MRNRKRRREHGEHERLKRGEQTEGRERQKNKDKVWRQSKGMKGEE